MTELPNVSQPGSRTLPGVDLDLLTSWLDSAKPGLRQGELVGEVIVGGKSNLTYRITDGANRWALRRPPLAHVLPTAHDMVREYRVISALTGSSVAVAEPVALCRDPELLGAPFYLMGFVDGVVLDRDQDVAAVTPPQATSAGEALIDTLVALHSIDPNEVGLADFGRPVGYLQRQVSRWHKQWDASETRPLDIFAQVVDELTNSIPDSETPAIVHGDYRMTNVIFDPDFGRVAAVVDWEMATLGDPLTDIGLLAVYHRLALESGSVMPKMTPSAGFLSPDELLARYAAGSGRDLSDLSWYVAFGYFKLAVVGEGIAARFAQGKTVGPGFAEVAASVPALLESAHAELTKG
ncbi:phosphotransferase family protein [Jatrophihabitans sp. GAS493]|uniref:phosphotransferase family protein n=1 Tax=Jatrophihabitans sp. GAS493 TaxID=1907575 RepID=UPI001F53789D|nr:phosphotransferase family protein [Jatrophihabitans sp. GAS493]